MLEIQRFTIPIPALHFVLSQPVWQNLASNKRMYPDWPESPQEINMYLQNYYRTIPILVGTEKKGKYSGSKYILFCTRSFYLKAVPSKGGDAYTIIGMRPLSLYEHDDLARGAPRVQVGTWFVHTEHRALNAYRQTNPGNAYQAMLQMWGNMQLARKALTERSSGSTETNQENAALLSPVQEQYLNQVEKVVKTIHEVEVKKGEHHQPILYGKVEAVGKARYNRHDAYRFQRVPSGGEVAVGMFLCLEDDVTKRGRVSEVEKEYFIFKFEQAVEIRTVVNHSHALIRTTGDASYNVQRRTLEMLRNGIARNRHLLRILAEDRYQPYQKRALGRVEKLNAAQQEAFERALSTPDIQLVLGPPGTGKTHTIVEIIRALSKRRERVLITAKTHKAVDNVLAGLPREIEVLRVGDADKVIHKHLLIDERARDLQNSILHATQEYSQELRTVSEHLAELNWRAARLSNHIEVLRQAEQKAQWAMAQRDQRRNEIKNAFAQEQARRYALCQTADQNFTQQQKLIQTLQDRYTKAAQRQNWILIGFFWRNRLPKLQGTISQAHYDLAQKLTQKDAANTQYQHLVLERAQAFQTREYQQLEIQLEEQNKELDKQEKSAYSVAIAFANILTKHFPPEQLRPLGRSSQELQSYLSWLQSMWVNKFHPTLLARDELMRDWRQELGARTEDLYPILLRMADVIGATCIGSATAKILAEVEYDMVIVDEAGQISVTDLLVPLVQGQRALLVGDHQQLPPLADQDVEKRLQLLSKEEGNEIGEQDIGEDTQTADTTQLTDLLKKSVFEMLVQNIDKDHYVPLTQQHRMPASIARFVSQYFYGGRLETAGRHAGQGSHYRDPLFNKPFVFIDTRSMAPDVRKEQRNNQSTEADGSRSYVNDAEAKLITDIAEVYARQELQWVVIVPYKGQAQLIRQMLQLRLGKTYDLDLETCVATVDTFQGGEKDIVMYSFTRSNKNHNIGFLKELRRLNVAVTRAKEQLVMMGDSETLTETHEQNFRKLARAMLQYAREHGELLDFRDCRSRLSRRESR